MSFWHRFEKPLLVLAPLADVTDAPFRRLIAKYSAHERSDKTTGGPDIMWTEFVSADGLVRADEAGREKLLADLIYTEAERPIIAQLFSATPAHMEAAARLCRRLGFNGVDINMGCPDRTIEKQGCGAAMIKDHERARAVIHAAKRGAGDLPVSVKTRLGYNSDELEEWLPALLAESPAAITVHARTRKEMSKVPARWERVARAVEIRNAEQQGLSESERTLILGNGDLESVERARAKARACGADGAMLGRAIFGNPWLFHPTKDLSNVSLEERLAVMVEHTKLFEELLPHKNFAIMKKHYKAYANGFDGAKELRTELMNASDAQAVAHTVERFTQGWQQ